MRFRIVMWCLFVVIYTIFSIVILFIFLSVSFVQGVVGLVFGNENSASNEDR